MNNKTVVRLLLAASSIVLTLTGLNNHFYPIYIISVNINEVLGLPGVFVLSGILSASIYMIASRVILKESFRENIREVRLVAIVTYLLLAFIWAYLSYYFKPS